MSIPKVYIACLAAYNAGFLHGQWIDLDGTVDLDEEISKVLKSSPEADAGEWAVHDFEYCVGLCEYTGSNTLKEIIAAYEACDRSNIEWEPFIRFCEHLDENPAEKQVVAFQEAYAGKDENLEAWAIDFIQDTGGIEGMHEHLRFYFNYEAYARDLEINDVFTVEHKQDVLVFWRH